MEPKTLWPEEEILVVTAAYSSTHFSFRDKWHYSIKPQSDDKAVKKVIFGGTAKQSSLTMAWNY